MEIKQFDIWIRLTISFVLHSRHQFTQRNTESTMGKQIRDSCRIGRIRAGWEGDAGHLKTSSVIRRCGVPAVLILKGGKCGGGWSRNGQLVKQRGTFVNIAILIIFNEDTESMAPTTRAFPSSSSFYHLISYASHAYNSRSPTSEQTSVSSVIFLLFLFSFFRTKPYRDIASRIHSRFFFFFFLPFFLRDETFLHRRLDG